MVFFESVQIYFVFWFRFWKKYYFLGYFFIFYAWSTFWEGLSWVSLIWGLQGVGRCRPWFLEVLPYFTLAEFPLSKVGIPPCIHCFESIFLWALICFNMFHYSLLNNVFQNKLRDLDSPTTHLSQRCHIKNIAAHVDLTARTKETKTKTQRTPTPNLFWDPNAGLLMIWSMEMLVRIFESMSWS